MSKILIATASLLLSATAVQAGPCFDAKDWTRDIQRDGYVRLDASFIDQDRKLHQEYFKSETQRLISVVYDQVGAQLKACVLFEGQYVDPDGKVKTVKRPFPEVPLAGLGSTRIF